MERKSECGDEEDFSVYKKPDELKSCDKYDHSQRSLVSQPNHAKRKNNIRPSDDEFISRSRAGGN